MVLDRYRPVALVGVDASVNAEFWQATDSALRRDVGLAVLRRTGERGERERAAAMLAQAARWGTFEHFGCARLLDVVGDVPGDVLGPVPGAVPGAVLGPVLGGGTGFGRSGLPADLIGLTITEWVPGSSLAETLAAGPRHTGDALQMLDTLARAAETAHRTGLALGCSHPSRIRFDPEGAARQAFALPAPDSAPADDVRGLGATLYALLTGYWPLPCAEAEFSGLPAAPRDAQGMVAPPETLRMGLSMEVSALTMAALGAGATDAGMHTAAAVHTMLVELAADERGPGPGPHGHTSAGLRLNQWATACRALRGRLLSGANRTGR